MMKHLTVALFTLSLSGLAHAQNTGGVFGPVVNEDHKSFQYRIGVDPDNAAGETGYAQRIHYQQALDDNFMWRVIGQTQKTNDSNNDFDYLQAELFWELEGSKDYQTGVRFDLRYRDNNRPNQVGVNWMNQYHFDDNWYGRFLVLTTAQFGDNSADGIGLQTRFNLAKKYDFGEVGVELFNSYGSTEKIPSFSSQQHSIGPYMTKKVGKDGWSIFAGALFGITSPSPDTELRFWVTKSL